MMTFTPTRDGRGFPLVVCTCEECGTQKPVRCDMTSRTRDKTKVEPNVGQAVRKLSADGWTFVKQRLRCPECEAKRRKPVVAKEPTVIEITPPPVAPTRQPTRDQKRLIVTALEDAYDVPKQRYRDGETDKTIAEMLGDGIMPGWVGAVRDDMFGPEGNEEMADLAKLVADWMGIADSALARANEAIAEMAAARAEVKKLGQRLDKVVAAIGPKAEKL